MKERQVEKLTPDMVGMEALINREWRLVEHVGKMYMMTEDGFTYGITCKYTIRDPKEKEKLPSERLVWGDHVMMDILDELWMRTEK